MNSTLQIRIDKATKNKAGKIFKEMGIDTSSGIKLFLSYVINTGSVPFIPTTKNGFSATQEKEIIAETKEAIANGKRFSNPEKLHASITRN